MSAKESDCGDTSDCDTARGLRSPAWIATPLALSVVALVPAFPVSLGLTAVALLAVLLTRPRLPHRRKYLWAVLGWLLIQAACAVVGTLVWSSWALM